MKPHARHREGVSILRKKGAEMREIDGRDPDCNEAESTWSVKVLWPQARAELLGLARQLDSHAGLTAAQLRMALRLATEAAESKIDRE